MQFPAHKACDQMAPMKNPATTVVFDNPLVGASMMLQSRRTSPVTERIAPMGSSRGPLDPATLAAGNDRPPVPRWTTGTLIKKDRSPPEVPEQDPPSRVRRNRRLRPRGPGADGPARSRGVGEDVGQKRQGGRHDQRRAHAHEGPVKISWVPNGPKQT